jgi:hypothetical protein
MFSKDLVMSVDYFGKLVDKLAPGDSKAYAYLAVFKANLEDGLGYYQGLVESRPYPGENLASLKETMAVQGKRLSDLWTTAGEKSGLAPSPQKASA